MSNDRMFDDAELDTVSAGQKDGLLVPVIIATVNKVLGTDFPVTIEPPPARCHPQ